MTGKSYLLVECDSYNLASIRRALHEFTKELQIEESDIVFHENRKYPYLSREESARDYQTISRLIHNHLFLSRELSKRLGRGFVAQCCRCGRRAMTLSPARGIRGMVAFLNRLDWRAVDDFLVCSDCADEDETTPLIPNQLHRYRSQITFVHKLGAQ